MPNKLSSKKRRQINKNKQKTDIRETSSRKAIINNLSYSNKKQLPVFILAVKKSLAKTQDIDIAIIGTYISFAVCHLKEAQIFVISMKNIQYQAKNKVRAEINSKSIIPKKYHDFLNIFLKKKSDILFLH